MENLNKENTWAELKIQFPKEIKDFFDWIDEYKIAIDWKALFNSASEWQDMHGKNAPAPKFHDIPFEMQMGIIIAYFSEREVLNNAIFSSCSNIPRFKKFLQERFNMIKINNDLQP